MPQQANQPLPEGYQLEGYRIASVLSCGGFSIVYLAYDENDQPVAIKEYLPSQLALRNEGDALPSIAEENLATFRYGLRCFFEEGRSLARLSHPNVVRVLNFFRANETVYMVMRYERGRTLQEHIQLRRGTIKEKFIRNVFYNYNVQNVVIENRGNIVHATVTVDPKVKGRAIGKNGRNLKIARDIVNRHHNVQSISVA